MPRYTLPVDSGINFSEGADRILVYVAQQVPLFIPLTLTAFFLIIMISGYFAQTRREGRGDMPQWFAIAGFSTMILTLMMTLIDGLINPVILSFVVVIAIVGGIWLFTSKGR